MSASKEVHHRRSIRLKGFDYGQSGAYFITICTYKWRNLFGDISGGKMSLNPTGQIVEEEWQQTGTLRTYVTLDEYIIMPNHLHGILLIEESGKDTARRVLTTEQFGKPVPKSLPTIVRAFKSASTRQINEMRCTPGHPVWHRNYFEHIIRTDQALNRIRTYIRYNPERWQMDMYNPEARRPEDVDKWIATDALRELRSAAVQNRLITK